MKTTALIEFEVIYDLPQDLRSPEYRGPCTSCVEAIDAEDAEAIITARYTSARLCYPVIHQVKVNA